MARKRGRPKLNTMQVTIRMDQDEVKLDRKLAELMPGDVSMPDYYGQCIEAIREMITAPEPMVPRLVIALRAIRATQMSGSPTSRS